MMKTADLFASLVRHRGRIGLAVVMALAPSMSSADGEAADLQPRTVAAFDRYVRIAEAGMNGSFLRVDGFSESDRRLTLGSLQRGELTIERLTARDAGKSIEVPGGLIHHWIGAVFVPGATVDEAVGLLQDYGRHAEIYRPAIAQSRLLDRNGDVFHVYLRFFMKKVLTVVVNTENEARFTRPAPDRAQSRIYSTRIAEVEDPDTPQEHEKAVGHGGGYLWRLNSYWHFLERDGGTYVQCESISLTRGIPFGLGVIIGPFVNSIPRESLTFMLETTRKTLARTAR